MAYPPALAWAPAKLSSPAAATATSPTRAAATLPKELAELAKQLELVERQRQQLLLRASQQASSHVPRASPSGRHSRPQSPSTVLLAPLPPPSGLSPSPTKQNAPSSVGLAPASSVSDVAVCDLCAAELPSAAQLRAHKASHCLMRVVRCPRAGCGASFLAHERSEHDRDCCVALQRTQQLLDDHRAAHTLVLCDLCGDQAECRGLADHKLFGCVKRVVLCQFEAFGCRERFPFDHRAAHEATSCRVVRARARILSSAASVNDHVACDWCEQLVLKRRLLTHQEEECVKRERPCPNAPSGCAEWVAVEAMDRHVRSDCVVTRARDAMAAHFQEMTTLVVCAECGAYVQRRHLTGHVAAECVSRVVACKNRAHGCKARLRWRDRHVHEDFLALAHHERSMLQFPVGGGGYVVLHSETSAQLENSTVDLDLPPPWTLELFVWVIDAKDEIVDLHAQSLEQIETAVAKQRELERFQQQSKECKQRLKELKHLHKSAKDKRSNSQLLGDVALGAKTLADEFAAAERGVLAAAQTLSLARGLVRICVQDAHRLLQQERQRDAVVAQQISEQIELQATDRMVRSEWLSGEFLSEDEQLRLGNLDQWAAAVAPQTAAGDRAATAAVRQQQAQEQRKLLAKRAVLTESTATLQRQEHDGVIDNQEATRLRRRYERELAKLEAKLLLVSNNTPPALLGRRGRHVVLSSARNAIVLSGADSGRIAYVSTARGEVSFPVALTRSRWHHVALCATKSELSLLVDGAPSGVQRGAFELPFARLGSNERDSFQGVVQEVRVWSTSLSPEYLEANAHAIVEVERHRADLVAYYTFEEGAGNVVDDMALRQPRAACFGTRWQLYSTAAARRLYGPPPTPSLRDRTSCVANQRLQLLAQRARDRATEPAVCPLRCGVSGLVLRELERHIRESCVHRVVVCAEPGCEQTYRFCDASRHGAVECARAAYREELARRHVERQVEGPCLLGCGAMVARRHAEQHYLRQCTQRLVACPQRDCGESVVAQSLESHLRVSCLSAELVAERRMVENARRRQQNVLLGGEQKPLDPT